jgi:hypothetical protein
VDKELETSPSTILTFFANGLDWEVLPGCRKCRTDIRVRVLRVLGIPQSRVIVWQDLGSEASPPNSVWVAHCPNLTVHLGTGSDEHRRSVGDIKQLYESGLYDVGL